MADIMIQPTYHTVYVIGFHTFPWGGILFWALPIGIGLALIAFSRGRQIQIAVGAFVIIFSLFCLLPVSMSTVSVFMRFRNVYANGNYSVIEGGVEDYHPMRAPGPGIETFTVRGITFSYNRVSDTCFNDSNPPGIIQPGIYVRIFYTNGCILRLDVRN